MKPSWKSLISLLLVLVFVFQLFPASVLAVEPDDDALTQEEIISADQGQKEESSETANTTEAFVVEEVESLREESVKHFHLSDGSFAAVQYNSSVHFQDSENKWQEISGSLVKENDSYVSRNGSVSLSFPSVLSDNHLFDIAVGNYSLKVSLYENSSDVKNDSTPAPTSEMTILENESIPSENTVDGQSTEIVTEEEQILPDSDLPSDSKNDEGTNDDQSSIDFVAEVSNSTDDRITESFEPVPSESVSAKAEVKNFPATSINPSSEKLPIDDITSIKQAYSEIKYPEALPNADLIYENYGYSIKESILIKQPQDEYIYKFLIECCDVEPELLEDGSITFTDAESKSVFIIPAPHMIDAAGQSSFNAKYCLDEIKEGWLLSVTADTEWMNDTSRVYPVALDPSVKAQPNGLLCTMPVTYVTEGSPSASHYKPSTIAVGYGGSSTKQQQSFIGMPLFPYLTYHTIIINAELQLKQCYYSGSSIPTTYIGAHQVTSAPGNSDYNAWFQSMTWNTKPSYSSETIDHAKVNSGTYAFSLDITRAVKNWYSDSSITRAVALISEDTSLYSGNYSGTSYIYGDGGDFLHSTNEPTLIISYRNDVGLEDYYTYRSYDVGEAGTAYISDHTGDLTVVTPLVSFASNTNPFALNLVYMGAKNNLNTVPTLGLRTKLGSGMTLNIIQKVTVSGNQAVYTDGDGTTHYFIKDNNTNYYYDEDGLGLKIQVQDQWHTIMTDDHGNQWTFMNGYLALIQDGNGNQYEIHYIRGDGVIGNWHPCGTNDTLESVVQVNNGFSGLTIATFTHDNDGYLTSITDFANRIVTLQYQQGYFYPNLIKIKRNNIDLVSFSYPINLSQIKDCVTNIGLLLTNDSNGCVTSVQFFGGNTSNTHELTSISRENNTATYTTNQISTTYIFDNIGRTVNAYTSENDFTIGASNSAYFNNDSTNRKNNRTLQTSSIGVPAQTWLRNGTFEYTPNYPWTFTGAQTTNTNIVINGNKTRTGSFALKGWLQSGSTGTTSATRQSYNLNGNLKYSASVYVNSSEITSFGTNGKIKLSVHNTLTGSEIASDSINYSTSSDIDNGWVRLSVSFQSSSAVNIRISAINAQGIFYADDVQLEPASPSSTKAAPSSVNLLDDGFVYSNGWKNYGTSISTFIGRTSQGESTRSIQAVGSPSAAKYSYQTVPINISGNYSYVLSGWAKATSIHTKELSIIGDSNDPVSDSKKRFGLCADILYSNEDHEYHYVPFNSDILDWQFVSAAIVPKQSSQNVVSITVYCVYNYNKNTAYFDDLSLVRETAQTMTYDSNGNLTSVKNTGNTANQNTYSNGNLTQSVTPCNGTLTYSYNNNNNPHLVTNISNGTANKSVIYDPQGNIKYVNHSSDDVTTPIREKTLYTNSGNLVGSKTSFGNYDDAYFPHENSTYYTYSSNYNKMTGLPSFESHYNTSFDNNYDTTYDRITQIDEAYSGTISYTYDLGNISSINRTNFSGGASQSYSFTHDSFGQRTSTNVGNTTLATYAYDNSTGNLISTTLGNGVTTSFSYDPLYRLTQQTTTAGNSSRTINYTYSGDGNLYRREDSQGETVTYNYDNLNRPAGLSKTNGDTCNLVTNNQYDNCNRLTRFNYQLPGLFNGYEGFYYRTSTNSSGPVGSLESMSLFSYSWINYTYDHLQRLHTRKVGMILQESYNYATSTDSGTPLSTTQVQAKAIRDINNTNNALNRWEYTYDRAGNILSETNNITNQVTTYTYDRQNQLTKVVAPNITYQYFYDNAGNILSSYIGNTSHTYTYGNSQWKDLLTEYDGHSITYDAIGNPLSYYNGSSYSFTWTEGRRLQNATKSSSTTSYAYDADGLRTRKTNSDGSYIDYYWADGMLLVERKCNASGTQQYVIKFLYDESCLPVGMSYRSGASNTGSWSNYYYAKNLQGDIVGLYYSNYVNETTYQQSLVATYEYDPWGNVTVKNSAGTVNPSASFIGNINPLRFKGYYYDRETGFYYLQSRYYDPAIGRFISADDVSYLGANGDFISYNLFAYCGNNPVTGYDPAGTLDWGKLFKGGSWLAIGVTAIAVGVSVLTCGVAAPAMMAVATVTVAAGAATAVNGVSELGEAATRHNFMRDDVFRGNANAYNTYAHTTAAVAEIGIMVCGGWLKANAPRIEAYNNIENYQYTNTISDAQHMSRPYANSVLTQKEVIKYGKMTEDPFGYVFSTMGLVNGKEKLWRLGVNIGGELIWHWGHGF